MRAGPAAEPEADGARPSPIAEAAGHRCAPSVGSAMSTIMSEADRLDGDDIDLIAGDAVLVDVTRGAGRENDRGCGR